MARLAITVKVYFYDSCVAQKINFSDFDAYNSHAGALFEISN